MQFFWTRKRYWLVPTALVVLVIAVIAMIPVDPGFAVP